MADWTDDEVRKEINDAVRIAREDGILKHVRGLAERLDKLLAGPDGHPPDDTTGQPPPPSDPKPSGAKDQKKRRSLWWGEAIDE